MMLCFTDIDYSQTPLPSGLTPASATPSDMDPASLISTDFSDFTVSLPLLYDVGCFTDSVQPMDLGGWLDGMDYTGPELWDTDLFSNIPVFP
jgi:hypothetical protein